MHAQDPCGQPCSLSRGSCNRKPTAWVQRLDRKGLRTQVSSLVLRLRAEGCCSLRHLLCEPRRASPRAAWWLCQDPITANLQSGVSGRGEGQPFMPRGPALARCWLLSSHTALVSLHGPHFPLSAVSLIKGIFLLATQCLLSCVGTPRVGPSCLCKREVGDPKPVLRRAGLCWATLRSGSPGQH